MTFEKLAEIMERNQIPKDVKLMSDSGWECCETDMDGLYYSKSENVLIFTQHGDMNIGDYIIGYSIGNYNLGYRNSKYSDLKEVW